jgi:hypothetical protein
MKKYPGRSILCGIYHFDVLETKRGYGGGTFAYWQIALAYAKYLSPEFYRGHGWS